MASYRSRRNRRSRRQTNEMNVVPYIDVMLVLLVIFMVTAPMITPGLVNLPSVGQSAEVPSVPIEIQLREGGDMAIRLRDSGKEFESIDQSHLLDEVKALAESDTPIVIAADGKVPYEDVMKIMDKLRSNGMTRLGLLVNQKTDHDS